MLLLIAVFVQSDMSVRLVAEGRFQPDGSFVATNLLAKHDANYKPPQLAGAMHKTESLKQ